MEILLVDRLSTTLWTALAKPAKRARPGLVDGQKRRGAGGLHGNARSVQVELVRNARGQVVLVAAEQVTASGLVIPDTAQERPQEAEVIAVGPDEKAVVSEDAVLGGYSAYSEHYAMSKLVAEGVVRFMARELNLPTTIARLDVAYGLHGHGGLPNVLCMLMQGGSAIQTRLFLCPYTLFATSFL